MALSVLITGAAGNVGTKLAAHLRAKGGYELTLLDRDPRGRADIIEADLAEPGPWEDLFAGQDVIVHLVANPASTAEWEDIVGPNFDATLRMYAAAERHKVPRVVFASSVWAMAARRDDARPIDAGPAEPGAVPYGLSKAFGERLGAIYAQRGIDTVAIRLGGCRPGDNPPEWLLDPWEDSFWTSNIDACNGFECAIRADTRGFRVINLTSDNPARRWSLKEAKALGFRPQSGLPRASLTQRLDRRLRKYGDTILNSLKAR